MADTTITCPHCHQEIRLTDALAAPFIEKAREELAAKFKERTDELLAKAAQLEKDRADVEKRVAASLEAEREKLSVKLADDARKAVEHEMDGLRVRNAAGTKKAEEDRAERIDLLKKLGAAEAAKAAAEEAAQKSLNEEREKIRKQARESTDEAMKLALAEKDEALDGLKKTVEQLQKKLEQGSQQRQGEAQEIVLEDELRSTFPLDTIEPVAKGTRGGDCFQHVFGPGGVPAGTILWEAKRTRNWSDAWIPKLKDDQREAKADLAILLSATAPKDVESFGMKDGVWVTDFASALPLAAALRHGLIQVAGAKRAASGQQTKMELVYEYLSGAGFRRRVEAVADVYRGLTKDLDAEKKVFTARWAKRQAQIDRLRDAMGGLYGDLQGIMGQTLAEVETLELRALAPPDEVESEDAD